MLLEWAWIYFKTISGLAIVNFLYFIKFSLFVYKKASLRVSHELSIDLKYRHQDQNLSI